jgi:hypothetical protein
MTAILIREGAMSDVLTPLTLDFLKWLAAGPRPYAEVMDVWRTSCPRLTVWEDAIDAGLVAHRHEPGKPAMVAITPPGAAMLDAHRR